MGNAKNINEMELTNQCIVLVKNWGLVFFFFVSKKLY
jgi:hypothetical protein